MADLGTCKACGKPFIRGSILHELCYPCYRLQQMKIKQKLIQYGQEEDTVDNEFIICPNCGNFIKVSDCDYVDLPEQFTKGDSRMTCINCNKDYILNVAIEQTFETRKAE